MRNPEPAECPFCKSNNSIFIERFDEFEGNIYGYIKCNDCFAQGPKVSKGVRLSLEDLAAIAWNKGKK